MEAEFLYENIIVIAQDIAAAMGLEKEILIPTHKNIHSNNERFQQIIASKNYDKREFDQPKRFSYKFEDYAFIAEVFVVPPFVNPKTPGLIKEMDVGMEMTRAL